MSEVDHNKLKYDILKDAVNKHCEDLKDCVKPLLHNGLYATAIEMIKAVDELKSSMVKEDR